MLGTVQRILVEGTSRKNIMELSDVRRITGGQLRRYPGPRR